MRMTGEAKPSEAKAVECKLSVSVIPVEKSRKEEKIFALSSDMAEFVVESKEDKQISDDGEGVGQNDVEEKDINEGVIPVDSKKRSDSWQKRRN